MLFAQNFKIKNNNKIMFKAQEVLEYILLLAVIILISVGFFYFYMFGVNNQKTTPTLIISNFQITNFTYTSSNCVIGLSFQSTFNNFTANQFNILAENSTGSQFNISVSTNNYSFYLTPEGVYQYSYSFISTNTPFCNIFTPQLTPQTGEILGLLFKINNNEKIYQFSTPIKTYYG
jgi:uncharacterized protein (UPF0333 family)